MICHVTFLVARELLLMGGVSIKDQLRALGEGVDVVVGTPGRLDDLIETGKLDLSAVSMGITVSVPINQSNFFPLQIRFFVLDEAVSHVHVYTYLIHVHVTLIHVHVCTYLIHVHVTLIHDSNTCTCA